jgi:hypothetical protein
MAIFVEGVRGSGKSKIAVAEIQIYLKSNRRVATNLDIDVFRLAPNTKSEVVRIPDIPRSLDLEQLGKAYPELDPDDPSTYDENKFGLIVIDELLVSFNSRSWNDSDRLKLVSWMVQSRKLGWRLWLICQDVDAVDKQLRETLLQEIWACRSGKNFFSSPVLGKLLNLIISPILKIVSPQGFHICKVFTGKRKDKINLAQTFFFKRYHLHPCYKTSQTFTPDNFINSKGDIIDMRASYCMLPSNYFDKSIQKPINEASKDAELPFFQKNKSLIVKSILFIGCVFGYLSFKNSDEVAIPDPTSALSTSVSTVSNSDKSAKTIHAMPQPDIPDLYITCSVVKSDDTGDYCFEYQGKPFDPVMVGYQVRYIAPCRAGLIDGDRMYIATCNPISVKSESIKANEPPQTQELQQNVAT